MSFEMLSKEMQDIGGDLIKFRNNMKRSIFGDYQEFGVRVYVNAHFVPTQHEPWGRYVASFEAFGSPGSGKTTGAFAGSCMMRAERNVAYGLEDITPAMLIGYVKHRREKDGSRITVHYPGQLIPERCCNIFDEVSRLNPTCFPAVANILADGIIRIGGLEIPCAPKGKPLINTLTANLLTSGGTKNIGEFLRDRITSSAILVTPWKDKNHIRQLLNLKEHWRRVKAEGLLDPFMNPEDIIIAHEAIAKNIEYPKAIEDYEVDMFSEVLSVLTEAGWTKRFKAPDIWKEAFRDRQSGAYRELPEEPLICAFGGRVPQQWRGLSQADSFLTYGSPFITPESAQQMLKAAMFHRLMYGLDEGGYKILAKVYNNRLIPFLEDTMNWVLNLRPLPKLKSAAA